MRQFRLHRLIRWPLYRICLVGAALLLGASLPAAAGGRDAGAELHEKYQAIQGQLSDNPFQAPVYLESKQDEDAMEGDVYAVLPYRFVDVEADLADIGNWCDIAILHLNVKACVQDADVLSFYVGRKSYQPLEDAYRIQYAYQLASHRDDFVDVRLVAEEGPMGTTDYRIVLEAVPLGGDKTFLRLRYAYKYGLLARLGMAGYLNTVGRDKIGFSKAWDASTGRYEYAGGSQGAIERNSMRYFLAIQAFMDTRKVPEERRWQVRFSHWYDLTDRFRAQLFEMSKREYLQVKRKEWQQMPPRNTALRAAAS